MGTNTSGATIFYKIGQNGFVDPTHENGQATNGTSTYTGVPYPVTLGQERHFSAVAYRAGMIDSVIAEVTVDNYDSGGTAPTAGSRTVTYQNDPLNRTSMIDNGTATVYGPTSGVNQYMSVSGHTLAYDANFNLSGYDAWSYVYDADKRLISASGSGTAMGQGHSAQFVYDGLGRCVKRTIDNVTTLITYDGWKPIAEWNGAGGLVAWNLYGPGADEILVRYNANVGHLYYHLDAHGHVRFLLNGNGEVIEKYTYDAFGQPKIMDGNGGETTTTSYENRFLFTGREYLPALGLYDYRHRVYHPGLGRFLQIDPLGLQIEGAKLSAQQTALYPAGTAPKTFSFSELNLYRYCHSDPVNKTDPLGLHDVNLLPRDEEASKWADKARISNDRITVVGHGGPRTMTDSNDEDLPVSKLAGMIRSLRSSMERSLLYSTRVTPERSSTMPRKIARERSPMRKNSRINSGSQ
jgi:RHS repeat-associated protein